MGWATAYGPELLAGLGVAAALATIGFLGALGGGAVLAACRLSPVAPLRAFGASYVETFRNIPLLCLIILVVFGLPDIGLTFSLFDSVALSLVLVNAAYVCEALRSGVNAVARGEIEAARALGFTVRRSLTLIVIPQSLRTTVQPLVNVFISTLLGSSLASAVGVSDLIGVAQYINLHEAWGIGLFAAAAAVYSTLALGAGRFGSVLERRFAVRR